MVKNANYKIDLTMRGLKGLGSQTMKSGPLIPVSPLVRPPITFSSVDTVGFSISFCLSRSQYYYIIFNEKKKRQHRLSVSLQFKSDNQNHTGHQQHPISTTNVEIRVNKQKYAKKNLNIYIYIYLTPTLTKLADSTTARITSAMDTTNHTHLKLSNIKISGTPI